MERKRIRSIVNEKYNKYIYEIISRVKKLDASSMLSGDDSNLENVWKEFAYQVQEEHSYFFDLYEDLISQIINDLLKSIDTLDVKLLWLESDGYFDTDDEDLDKDGFPSLSDMNDAVRNEIYSRTLIQAEMESLSFEHEEDEEFKDDEDDDI